MTDHDRLELDEQGRVVGATAVVDLHAGEDLATTPVQRWVDDVAAPWAARHRTAIRVVALGAVAVAGGALWLSTRPPEVVPAFAVDVENAVLAGNSIGGPEISPDGVLSVAFVATGRGTGGSVSVTGLRGPGLASTTAVVSPPLVDGVERRVEVRAQVVCTDPAVATASPTDYALTALARTGGGSVVDGAIPLVRDGEPVTLLDNAIGDWCLASLAPTAATVDDVAVTPVPGTTLLDLAVTVRNTAAVPLSFAATARTGDGVLLDRSPSSVLAPGASAVLPTRADVLDCLRRPALPDRTSLTLTLGLGDRTRLESYAVPASAAVGTALAQVCAQATGVDVAVRSTDLRRDGDGWAGDVVLALRTTGIGVTAGVERFAEPGSGASGPVLLTEGEGWAVPPTTMSGGAGGLPVSFSGASCEDVETLAPQTVPLRVLMADGTVVPYAVPVDDVDVLRAVAAACGADLGPSASARGWVAASS